MYRPLFVERVFRQCAPRCEEARMSPPEDDAVIPLSVAPTVLVVDDELTPRSIICRMVRGMGYQVRTARNGREALRYLKQHP